MGNHRQQQPAGAAHPPPPSPTAKTTAKYTNKDGSKFITVPKANSSTTDSAQPSPSLDAPDSKTMTQSDPAGPGSPAQPQAVNRKKQKRREKAALKALAEQAPNRLVPPSPTDSAAPSLDRRSLDVEYDMSEPEDEEDDHPAQQNGVGESAKSSRAKKKKKKAVGTGADDTHSHHDYHDLHDHHDHVHHGHGHNHAPHPPPVHRGPGISKEKIWNTSSQEERERIKEFWLGLGEDERKSLVKVEKDAVLKKMKEQQKHTCSCTVCGRKRNAIEEELEGLYDAYYEELEQYAHHPNQNGEGPPMMGPPKHFGPVGNRVGSSLGPPSNYPRQPSRGRIVEHVSDDEEDDGDEYESDEEPDDDDGYDEDEPPEVTNRNDYASDFFAFGNSLTVQGGILTVADDLLKNDGRKFIEMMEQLAERRMAREEDAKEQYSRTYGHANGGGYGQHSHPPAPEEEEYEDDEEEYEEDDEEEYDSQEEEDAMTEDQRMEEGRRMFQIFAARMFEQRVLQAYREKVSKEREKRLLEELAEESKAQEAKKEKKAKEAQKRKDKAARKKEVLAEQKARKDAEKAAEDAARLAEEASRVEEQRQRAEEKRRKKETQRRAEEEERLRKEAEKQRRIHEQKEKQAEQERRAREAKEKERKLKEETARQKEKEVKDRKDLEARERKEQQDREKKEREAKSRAEREATEKLKQEQQKLLQKIHKQPDPVVHKPAAAPPTATPIALVKRPAQHAKPTAVPALPQQPAAAVASPQISVATPAIPKAPLTMRNRQPSQQGSSSGSSQSTALSESNPSQAPSPHALTPSHSSPGQGGPPGKIGAHQPSQAASPMNMPPRTTMPPHLGGYGTSPMMAFGQLPSMPSIPPPGFGSPMHQNPAFAASPFGPFGSPGMVGLPGSLNRPPAGRSFGHPPPPPGFSQPLDPGFHQGFQPGPPRDNVSLHQRQSSIGFEHQSPSVSSAQPIGKPMPIGRPPSVAPSQRPAASLPSAGWGGIDLESHHLGSSALLDDSEEAIPEFPPSARRNTSVPGPGMPFPMFGLDSAFNNPWAPQSVGQQSFYGSPPPPPGFATQPQPIPWTTPGQMSSAFGPQNGMGRQSQPRSVAIRQLLCRACQDLVESRSTPVEERLDDNFVSLKAVKRLVDMNQVEPTADHEIKAICETLGNSANGGGSFDLRAKSGKTFVRWVPDAGGADGHPLQRAIGAPGGSPVVGSGAFLSGHGRGGI